MNCKSEGCRSEVTYKTTDRRLGRGPSTLGSSPPGNGGPTRVLSKYCQKHTCDHFYEVEGCNYKRPHFDMFCAVHTRCPIPGCNDCKAQYVDLKGEPNAGIKYLRHPFCPEHKCSYGPCPRERTPPLQPGGLYLPFCLQHRCQIEGCVKGRLHPFNFCKDHECKFPDCQIIVMPNMDLCMRHIACETRGCKKPRQKLSKDKEILPNQLQLYAIEKHGKNQNQYLLFCQDHGKCDTKECKGFRTEHSVHCPKHTCPERGCATSSGKTNYCDNHRCESRGCDNPKDWTENLKGREKFCPLHTCRENDCLEAAADLHLFCEEHECSKAGCISDAVGESLCLNHLKSKYQNDGKAKAKAEIEEYARTFGRDEDSGYEKGFVRLGDESRHSH